MIMARRRRPSIPLIILFVILLFLFLLAGPLVDIVSSMSARGTFTFSYTSNVNDPVVSIIYTLPQDLADAMVTEQTEGWTVTLTDTSLSVTDGTLNPGESVTVNYRLKEYIKGGTRTITATATTADGNPLPPAESNLEVPDAFLLAFVGMLNQYAIWLLILAIIVLVIIIVLFIIGKKKDEEQENAEGETGPASPPVSS